MLVYQRDHYHHSHSMYAKHTWKNDTILPWFYPSLLHPYCNIDNTSIDHFECSVTYPLHHDPHPLRRRRRP